VSLLSTHAHAQDDAQDAIAKLCGVRFSLGVASQTDKVRSMHTCWRSAENALRAVRCACAGSTTAHTAHANPAQGVHALANVAQVDILRSLNQKKKEPSPSMTGPSSLAVIALLV
jgi:hypothetical protein